MNNKITIGLSRILANKRPLVITLCIILVSLGVGSWHVLSSGIRHITMYKSPYTFQLQSGPLSQSLTDRLILVVVEGFELENANNLITIRDIANRGVATILRGNQGLTPLPTLTVLMTGAPPEISGIVTNWSDGKVRIGSLWSSAFEAGLNTIMVGNVKWKPLFDSLLTKGTYYEESDSLTNTQINDAIMKDAITEIRQGKSGLILVNFFPEKSITGSSAQIQPDVSRRGIELNIDRRLSNLLGAIDLSSETIIVILCNPPISKDTCSCLPKGSGSNLLVAAGAGIAAVESPPDRIKWDSARLIDVAPTCATLLGISMPTHSQGEALFNALDIPHHILSEVAIKQTDARAKFAVEYMGAVGRNIAMDWSQKHALLLHNDGDYKNAYEAAVKIDKDIISALIKTRSAMVSSSKRISVPIFIVIIALLILILAILLQDGLKRIYIAVAVILVYFTAYYALLLIRGVPLSSGIISDLSDLTGFYHGRVIDSGLSMGFTTIFIRWFLAGTKEHQGPEQGFFSSIIGNSFIVITLITQIGVFAMTQGFSYNFYLPDMQKSLRCFMYLIQLMVIGILSPVFAYLWKINILGTYKN
ncbi:MAG: hypothetical protein GX969_07690 [Firmicutes bacterium]|nr:hypothetical protein [Bacillota bacterium]